MAIAGFVRKMSGTTELDTDSMNRTVSQMVEEALRYNQVESVLDAGEEEDIFSPEYFEKLSDVKMPATKLELLIKMIRKEIKEYSRINKIAAKTYQEMQNYGKQYVQGQKKVHANELAYRSVSQKFAEGMVSVIELQTAANNLLQARSELLQARLQYIIKCRMVDYYNGEPLIRR